MGNRKSALLCGGAGWNEQWPQRGERTVECLQVALNTGGKHVSRETYSGWCAASPQFSLSVDPMGAVF